MVTPSTTYFDDYAHDILHEQCGSMKQYETKLNYTGERADKTTKLKKKVLIN